MTNVVLRNVSDIASSSRTFTAAGASCAMAGGSALGVGASLIAIAKLSSECATGVELSCGARASSTSATATITAVAAIARVIVVACIRNFLAERCAGFLATSSPSLPSLRRGGADLCGSRGPIESYGGQIIAPDAARVERRDVATAQQSERG